MSRPEHTGPPELFYNESEARKYAGNSRIRAIQAEMSERALELLALPSPGDAAEGGEGGEGGGGGAQQQQSFFGPTADVTAPLLLDIGCGSGISGEVLEEAGFGWVGVDVSRHMLQMAKECGASGDLLECDIGEGLPFRDDSFDGAVSISVLQWLCQSDRAEHHPRRRLRCFFEALYRVLRRGARAVLQFYPENETQCELITSTAMRAGFHGGIVVDFPNSAKAKKVFLVLMVGPTLYAPHEPEALDHSERVKVTKTRDRLCAKRKDGRRGNVKDKEWILRKKARMRAQGKKVRPDSKYTGRKRKAAF